MSWFWTYVGPFLFTFLGFMLGIISVYGLIFGKIQVDTSDPDADRYRIVFEKWPEDLRKRKYIMLKVEKDVDLSQEKPRVL